MIRAAAQRLFRAAWTARNTLVLGIAACLLALLPNALQTLPLDRTVSLADQPWRLLTAHLAHSDAAHLAWNLLGLGILGVAFEPLLRWRLPAILVLSALAIDLWFYAANDVLIRYCGLSGALNGLLFLGLLEWRRRSRELLPLLIGIGAAGKVGVEMMSGISVFTDPAWRSAPAAHLIGMLTAMVWHFGELRLREATKTCRTASW